MKKTQTAYLIELFENNDDFLLVTHINPDGDALGSICALENVLVNMGKRVDMCFDGTINERYHPLFERNFKKSDELAPRYDVAIALDCADKYRIGSAHHSYFDSKVTVNIDHHITNDNFADLNFVEDISATGELLVKIFDSIGISLSADACRYLYISIASDTGNFCYSNTTGKTFESASKLVQKFDHSKTARLLFNTRSYQNTLLLKAAIQNIELHGDGKIGFVSLRKSDMEIMEGQVPDYDMVIAFANEIDTVKVSAFIRELGNGAFKCSLRSKDDIDVAALAAKMGGGGHKNAAGFSMNKTFEQTKEEVLLELRKLI